MLYKDRQGRVFEGGTSQDVFLSKAYGSTFGRGFLRFISKPWFSNLAGSFLNTRLSTILIDSFLKNNHISLKEYIPCKYRSYNECFSRKIRPSRRPIDPAGDTLVSPSDGKLLAFEIDEDSVFFIKGVPYTVASMLRDSELAASYKGGFCLIDRLTVDNYHRYSYAVSGRKGLNLHLDGFYNTVNPIALDHVNVYSENSREYTIIDSDCFGQVIQMEVGALLVGRIKNLHDEADVVKGQEKGYFEFGGSTIVLLFKKNTLEVDADILKNSSEGIETCVKLGERIGRAVK